MLLFLVVANCSQAQSPANASPPEAFAHSTEVAGETLKVDLGKLQAFKGQSVGLSLTNSTGVDLNVSKFSKSCSCMDFVIPSGIWKNGDVLRCKIEVGASVPRVVASQAIIVNELNECVVVLQVTCEVVPLVQANRKEIIVKSGLVAKNFDVVFSPNFGGYPMTEVDIELSGLDSCSTSIVKQSCDEIVFRLGFSDEYVNEAFRSSKRQDTAIFTFGWRNSDMRAVFGDLTPLSMPVEFRGGVQIAGKITTLKPASDAPSNWTGFLLLRCEEDDPFLNGCKVQLCQSITDKFIVNGKGTFESKSSKWRRLKVEFEGVPESAIDWSAPIIKILSESGELQTFCPVILSGT